MTYEIFFADKEIKLYLLLLRNLPDYVNVFAYITLSYNANIIFNDKNVIHTSI